MSTAQAHLRIEPRALPAQASPLPSPVAALAPVRRFNLVRIAGRFVASGFTMMALTVVVAGTFEYLQPIDHLKPSYLVGNLTGRLAAEELASVEKAKAAFVEGVKEGEYTAQTRYDARLAKIEVAKQRAIQTMAHELQRTTAAWEAVYGLTNLALQGSMQMEAQLNQVRAETVARNQGVKGFFAAVDDFFGELGRRTGDPQLSKMSGNAARREMASEITSAGTQDAGAMTQKIMSNFPNPAEFRLSQDQALQKMVAELNADQ